MSDQIAALAKRLRALADELRSPDTDDERAEALAREAADLVAEAGNELERTLRDAGSEEA